MTRLRPLLIFGTRPEAIKMAPVVGQCRRQSDAVEATVCLTGQHREMLDQVTDYFGIRPDVDLDLMTPGQTLSGLTARLVDGLDGVLDRFSPDCVVVQGDTTTAMAAAMAAFHRRVPLVHVEAGLRTGDLRAPWPEEFNRRVIDMVAGLYCAPTPRAAEVLQREGAPPAAIHVTGNTVVDALLDTVRRVRAEEDRWAKQFPILADGRLVLITGHRRESFGQGLADVCRAVAALAERFADCRFVYPVHLNPNVHEPVRRLLSGRPNVHLLDPVGYPEFVWLMDRSTLIVTDSGGVQEEAPSLGKPVLVTRSGTERPEAVQSGAAVLVGTSSAKIVETAARLLTDPAAYAACQTDHNPFGDGHAAERIVALMIDRAWSA